MWWDGLHDDPYGSVSVHLGTASFDDTLATLKRIGDEPVVWRQHVRRHELHQDVSSQISATAPLASQLKLTVASPFTSDDTAILDSTAVML